MYGIEMSIAKANFDDGHTQIVSILWRRDENTALPGGLNHCNSL